MSLTYIGQQITIYGGFFALISGIIGNGLNIIIFSSMRIYRTNPCSFYFLIGSINNIIYLLINVGTRIINVGYGIDLTGITPVWCKIRQFSLVTISLITLSCSCLATINQFLLTSHNAYLRRYSRIEWAYKIMCIVIIVWCLHGIPCIVFYNIPSTTNKCTCTNVLYAAYIPICILVLISAIPVIVMIIFGWLTYRNIRQTIVLAEQHADRQLTRMALIQVALIIICISPYGFFSAYNLITNGISKDANRLINENFVATILSLLAYFYYSGSCYTFLISSNRFRRSIKDRILFCYTFNRVIPIQPSRVVRTTVENRTRA